jgi:hypothetical protein
VQCAAGWNSSRFTPRDVEYQLPPPTDPQDLLLLSLFSAKLKKETQQQPPALFILSPLYLVGTSVSPLFFSGGLDLLIIITRIITTPACLPVLLATLTWPRTRKRRRWLVLGASNLLGQGLRAAAATAAGRSKSISAKERTKTERVGKSHNFFRCRKFLDLNKSGKKKYIKHGWDGTMRTMTILI